MLAVRACSGGCRGGTKFLPLDWWQPPLSVKWLLTLVLLCPPAGTVSNQWHIGLVGVNGGAACLLKLTCQACMVGMPMREEDYVKVRDGHSRLGESGFEL